MSPSCLQSRMTPNPFKNDPKHIGQLEIILPIELDYTEERHVKLMALYPHYDKSQLDKVKFRFDKFHRYARLCESYGITDNINFLPEYFDDVRETYAHLMQHRGSQATPDQLRNEYFAEDIFLAQILLRDPSSVVFVRYFIEFVDSSGDEDKQRQINDLLEHTFRRYIETWNMKMVVDTLLLLNDENTNRQLHPTSPLSKVKDFQKFSSKVKGFQKCFSKVPILQNWLCRLRRKQNCSKAIAKKGESP